MARGKVGFTYERYAASDRIHYKHLLSKGLDESKVRAISALKREPGWMLEIRLDALKAYRKMPMPGWGADLKGIDFDRITYYASPIDEKYNKWDNVPNDIKKTFDRIGIPEAERKFLAGSTAQYDSEVVYHNLKKQWEDQGVVFTDMDTGLKEHPEIVREYFSSVVPMKDNKFAALNTAAWSGGCLTADSMIFTSNPGIKCIRDIERGDSVFALSRDGKIVESNVLAKVNSGKKPVYEFRVAGRTIKATENHMFLALEKSGTKINKHGKQWHRVWKKLGDLRDGDIVAIAKKIPNNGKRYKLPKLEHYVKNKHLERIAVPKESNEDLMWLLGILIGDGTIYKAGPHVCQINFALPQTDQVRSKAIKTIKKLFSYKVTTNNEVSFTVYSKALGNWFLALGFTGKAKTKKIPHWVFGLPNRQKLAFLGGILDSDGYVDAPAGAVVRFELANEQLIKQIKLLSISCGLFSDGKILTRKRSVAFFRKEKRKIYSGTSFSCRVTGDVKKIGSRNARIMKKLNYQKGTHDKYTTVTGENFSSETSEWVGFAPIKEKKLIGIEEVFDIQVEEHANFVANGIIAHNSFVHVPAGVSVKIPLQAYFRINTKSAGQFERTLIIAEEGASVTYLEGCSAPIYSASALHAAVVEIIAKKNSRVRYTTIQNWSNNVYNLVTKRAVAHENATVDWLDGNIGSKVNMKYPCVVLKGEGGRGRVLSIAFAGKGQVQDAGAKMIHLAPGTSSQIISKGISQGGGRNSYRGLVKIARGATGCKSFVQCDAYILDKRSRSDTYPRIDSQEKDATVGHEAKVGRISGSKLFYLMSRGIPEKEALAMVVLGFVEPFMKELPMEYAVELNRLIEMQMEKAVG